jgi:hypothetical protein
MKKLFTTLFVAGISMAAFASNDGNSVEIRQTETAKVAVSFNAVPKGTVFVKITDDQDRLILRDKITKTEAFSKKYDLNALPQGKYELEVMDQTGILRTASFDTHSVVETPEVYSRVSELGANKYRLLVSNLEAKEVEIAIYDGGKLVHTEKIIDSQGMHKIFTINNPSSEGIRFKVKTASGFESIVTSL